MMRKSRFPVLSFVLYQSLLLLAFLFPFTSSSSSAAVGEASWTAPLSMAAFVPSVRQRQRRRLLVVSTTTTTRTKTLQNIRPCDALQSTRHQLRVNVVLGSSNNENQEGSAAMISSINLKGLLDDNHEEEAARLAKSVTAWLDAEWMPQHVHVLMAQSVQRSYLKCRQQQQEHDLMAIMMTIVNDMEPSWNALYERDAFCNAFDIANYVADYLTQRAGLETCSCSHRIY